MAKFYIDSDVFTEAVKRIDTILDNFPKYYVSVSGGKDSSALVQLVIDRAKKKDRLPVNVLIVDLEAQYKHTIDYLHRIVSMPEVNAYWVCLPIHLRNSVSQFQPHWLCWDGKEKDKWVRDIPDHPSVISDINYFPFFRVGMEFEEFVPLFGRWFSDGEDTACFVGIRSDESINRFRTIANKSKTMWNNYHWTTKIDDNLYNAYPIYDWKTEDVWIAHGRNKWDYNKIYDLMNMAGVSIHEQRLCQPYGDDQRKGLWLYKILEPESWYKVVSRVDGANFGNRYVRIPGNVFGGNKITLPEGHTWKSYSKFLLSTMPPHMEEHYRRKIFKFLNWWRKVGRYRYDIHEIPDESDPKLESAGKVPSWRRICKTLLKNDYWCKTIGFQQTKKELEKQAELVIKYLEVSDD